MAGTHKALHPSALARVPLPLTCTPILMAVAPKSKIPGLPLDTAAIPPSCLHHVLCRASTMGVRTMSAHACHCGTTSPKSIKHQLIIQELISTTTLNNQDGSQCTNPRIKTPAVHSFRHCLCQCTYSDHRIHCILAFTSELGNSLCCTKHWQDKE